MYFIYTYLYIPIFLSVQLQSLWKLVHLPVLYLHLELIKNKVGTLAHMLIINLQKISLGDVYKINFALFISTEVFLWYILSINKVIYVINSYNIRKCKTNHSVNECWMFPVWKQLFYHYHKSLNIYKVFVPVLFQARSHKHFIISYTWQMKNTNTTKWKQILDSLIKTHF